MAERDLGLRITAKNEATAELQAARAQIRAQQGQRFADLQRRALLRTFVQHVHRELRGAGQRDLVRREAGIAVMIVLFCLAVTGVADYILRVVAPDLEAFEHFVVRDLLKTPGVKDVRSHFVIGNVKDHVGLPLTYVDTARR